MLQTGVLSLHPKPAIALFVGRSVNLESPEITKMNPSETRNRETTAVPLEIISSSLQHSQHTITAAELPAIDTLIAFQKGISSILRKE